MKFSPFLLERYFAEYEFTTQYHLSSSDCESITIKQLLDLEPESTEKLWNTWLGYTESLGNEQLRIEISQLYKKQTQNNILIHSGAQEAILNTLNTLVENPNDEIIVQFPCYQGLLETGKALGARVIPWKPKQELPWLWDLMELESLMSSHTKLLIINNPHNPTGALMSHHFYSELILLCQNKKIFLLSDEIYQGLELNKDQKLPSACDLYENALSLSGLSKSYGLPGLRIGWIATQNKNILETMAGNKDYTTICSSAPSEFLATIAVKHRNKLLQRNREIIFSNLKILEDFFKKYQNLFYWITPQSGSIAFPQLLQGTSEAFCKKVRKETGVLLVPSTKFLYGDQFIRFGFGRKNLPEALKELQSYL